MTNNLIGYQTFYSWQVFIGMRTVFLIHIMISITVILNSNQFKAKQFDGVCNNWLVLLHVKYTQTNTTTDSGPLCRNNIIIGSPCEIFVRLLVFPSWVTWTCASIWKIWHNFYNCFAIGFNNLMHTKLMNSMEHSKMLRNQISLSQLSCNYCGTIMVSDFKYFRWE